MGHTATVIGAVALACALVGLLCGYFWGRSKVRAQVEDAMDKARVSADAREFDLREQLSNKMVEVSELRARAEELPRLQEQLAQLKSQQMRGSASGGPIAREPGNAAPRTVEQKQEAPVIESTDKTIQNYLKSMEEKLKQSEQEPLAVTQKITPPPPAKLPITEPLVTAQKSTSPPPAKLPAVEPRAAAQKNPPLPTPPTKPPVQKPPIQPPRAVTPQKPKPAAGLPTAQPPRVKDEWQEFAASLEALTRQRK